MKIEPGKFYKTRDGRKARVYAVEVEGTYPIHGAHLRDGVWHADVWTKAGGINTYANTPFNGDIVSEWRDAPRVFWVNVYLIDGEIGYSSLYTSREAADRGGGSARIECIRVVESPEEDV